MLISALLFKDITLHSEESCCERWVMLSIMMAFATQVYDVMLFSPIFNTLSSSMTYLISSTKPYVRHQAHVQQCGIVKRELRQIRMSIPDLILIPIWYSLSYSASYPGQLAQYQKGALWQPHSAFESHVCTIVHTTCIFMSVVCDSFMLRC